MEDPGFQPRGSGKNIDWDKEERLGKMPDADLARELGVTNTAVYQARTRRNIPTYKGPGSSAGAKRDVEAFFSGKGGPPAPPGRQKRVEPEDRSAFLEKQADALLVDADGSLDALKHPPDEPFPFYKPTDELEPTPKEPYNPTPFQKELDVAKAEMDALPERVRTVQGVRKGWDAAHAEFKEKGGIAPLPLDAKVSGLFKEGWEAAMVAVASLPPTEPARPKGRPPKAPPEPVQAPETSAACVVDVWLSLQGVRDHRHFTCALSPSATWAKIRQALGASYLELPGTNGVIHFYSSASIDAVDVTPFAEKKS